NHKVDETLCSRSHASLSLKPRLLWSGSKISFKVLRWISAFYHGDCVVLRSGGMRTVGSEQIRPRRRGFFHTNSSKSWNRDRVHFWHASCLRFVDAGGHIYARTEAHKSRHTHYRCHDL